jgi:hypothetical protein
VTDGRKSNISLPEGERGGSLRGSTKYISIILTSPTRINFIFRLAFSESVS